MATSHRLQPDAWKLGEVVELELVICITYYYSVSKIRGGGYIQEDLPVFVMLCG